MLLKNARNVSHNEKKSNCKNFAQLRSIVSICLPCSCTESKLRVGQVAKGSVRGVQGRRFLNAILTVEILSKAAV